MVLPRIDSSDSLAEAAAGVLRRAESETVTPPRNSDITRKIGQVASIHFPFLEAFMQAVARLRATSKTAPAKEESALIDHHIMYPSDKDWEIV